MIDTHPFQHCECRPMGNRHPVCQAALRLEEKGKKVTLSPRPGEEAKALVLDGCVFTDNQLKCDALYLFRANGKKVIALVELKGAGDIEHAFEQLAFTRKHRPEYVQLKHNLDSAAPGVLLEKAFIVSNGLLSKPVHEKLENLYDIRVHAILKSEATSKIPDVRDYF